MKALKKILQSIAKAITLIIVIPLILIGVVMVIPGCLVLWTCVLITKIYEKTTGDKKTFKNNSNKTMPLDASVNLAVKNFLKEDDCGCNNK